ncbi:MATE family efflux transporter [Botryobacter ruber]|uniref:hypothetical protein n=1 Tax=Botryobacter ruber TaxID=2171629 RepID=UPI000E09EAEF|nr:hypothetical protein [Botryobacter ruber]
MAAFYGPNGITLYSHFQNLIAIITTVPDGGINIGTIRFLATEDPRALAYRQYFWAGMVLNLLCILVAIGIILGFPGYYLEVFFETIGAGNTWWWVAGFALVSTLLTYTLFLLAVLLSRRVLKWHVAGTGVSSLGGLAAVFFLGGKLSVGAVLLFVLAGQSLAFFFLVPVLLYQGMIPAFKSLSIPRAIYKDIGKYILMALSAVVCLKLTNFFIRDFIISRFGLYDTGLWQAVVKVSENYSLVYNAVLGMLYFPRIAALVNEEESLQKYVRNTFYLVFPGLAVALLLVYLLREWVLLLLFNKDFVVAQYLFDYQLLGDFFRMWSIVLTNLIVVKANVKLYIGWQITSAVFYIGLVFLLTEPFGLEGITIAHALRYAAVLAFSMIYYHKYIRLK